MTTSTWNPNVWFLLTWRRTWSFFTFPSSENGPAQSKRELDAHGRREKQGNFIKRAPTVTLPILTPAAPRTHQSRIVLTNLVRMATVLKTWPHRLTVHPLMCCLIFSLTLTLSGATLLLSWHHMGTLTTPLLSTPMLLSHHTPSIHLLQVCRKLCLKQWGWLWSLCLSTHCAGHPSSLYSCGLPGTLTPLTKVRN